MTSENRSGYVLKVNSIFKGIYSISCEYQNVEVEIFYTEQKTSKKGMDYVYFNKELDTSARWTSVLNALCEQQVRNVSIINLFD